MKAALALAAILLAGCAAEPPSAAMVPGATHELRGKITAAMVDDARSALARGVRDFTIDSWGGYVVPAFALGSELRKAGATVRVERECISACLYVLLSVPQRQAGPVADIRFHAACCVRDQREFDAFLAEWFVASGVPRDIVETYAGDVNPRRLSRADLFRMGVRL